LPEIGEILQGYSDPPTFRASTASQSRLARMQKFPQFFRHVDMRLPNGTRRR
jgi:hypothetical protein